FLLATAGFVTSYQQYGSALRIKRESHSPYTTRRVEPQLFHVRVPGILKRIDARAAEIRSELLEQAAESQNLILNIQRQVEELQFELFCDKNDLWHHYTYKRISHQSYIER